MKNRFSNGMIPCGVDALRFAFLRYNLTALDVNINIVESTKEGRRFCNKLWNLSKYVQKIFDESSFTYKKTTLQFKQIEVFYSIFFKT